MEGKSLQSHVTSAIVRAVKEIFSAVFSAFPEFILPFLDATLLSDCVMIMGITLWHLHSDERWASHSLKSLRDRHITQQGTKHYLRSLINLSGEGYFYPVVVS